MWLWRVVLVGWLAGCSSTAPTGPDAAQAALERPLETHVFNRVRDIEGELVTVEEVARWRFYGTRFVYEIETLSLFEVLPYPTGRARLIYEGNYWLRHVAGRRWVLHVERTGGQVFARDTGEVSVPPGNNTELDLLLGEETVTIGGVDYTYGGE